MSIEILTELSQRIQYLRIKTGLTQKSFGEKLGVSGSYISQLESGINREISATLAELISLKFHINKEWLLDNKGPLYVEVEGIREEPAPYMDDVSRQALQVMESLSKKEREDVVKFAEFLRDKKKKEGL